MAVKVIGTHDGPFHADDVMACALLKRHPDFKDAKIVRTRDEVKLGECDIVVDVGEKFSHEDRRYDHHQADFTRTMEEISKKEINSETKLSSAGLIYFFYGKKIIRECLKCQEMTLTENNETMVDWIWKKIYFNLIHEIESLF